MHQSVQCIVYNTIQSLLIYTDKETYSKSLPIVRSLQNPNSHTTSMLKIKDTANRKWHGTVMAVHRLSSFGNGLEVNSTSITARVVRKDEVIPTTTASGCCILGVYCFGLPSYTLYFNFSVLFTGLKSSTYYQYEARAYSHVTNLPYGQTITSGWMKTLDDEG